MNEPDKLNPAEVKSKFAPFTSERLPAEATPLVANVALLATETVPAASDPPFKTTLP